MFRITAVTIAAAVAAAGSLALAACAGPAQVLDRSAARPSAKVADPPAVLLTHVPPGLVVPGGFDRAGGFALHTVVSGSGTDGAVRDSWELLPQGVATYGTDTTGHPVVELASFTGRSRWHHEIAHPLTHDGQPALTPTLLSVTQRGTTWVVLVERGAEPDGAPNIMRLTTWNAATGQPGATARQPGADHGLTTRGGNVAISVGNPDGEWDTVLMDPVTGKLTHYANPGRNQNYAWNQSVIDTYRGEPVYLRQCTAIFTTGTCPSGLIFHNQPISWHGAPGTSPLGLVATPGGTLLGDLDLDTGKKLPLQCNTGTTRGVPSSPSGRYAIVEGNVIDFRADTSTCLGQYPYWTSITDHAVGYGRLQDGRPARIDLNTSPAQITPLPANTLLPLGIAQGGYGVFATDGPSGSNVIVLPHH